MKIFTPSLRTSLLALCLALLTLLVWQQQSGWFKATSLSPSARAATSSVTFTPTQWRSEGREIAGFSAQLSRAAAAETPTAPAGLKPAETAAWLALAERQSTTAKQSRAGKPLASFYPAQYGAPFIVEGNGVRVAVKPLGGAPVAATVADNQVMYRGAYPATDSRHVVTEGRSEEFLSLASAAAPREFAYEVSEMSAGTAIKLVDGAVHFTNASGQGVQIEAPWVKEPQGEKRTDVVRWELEAGEKPRLTLRLTSADLQYPLVIDPSWSATGALATARYSHTATLLPNGKVLVAGGRDSSFSALNSAELYDPATGMWSATGALATARYYHTATLLPNGKVLVAGGIGSSNTPVNSAELYDPATGMWSATGALATARYYHTATLLPNGKVLVAAGDSGTSILNSTELYDPATGMWSATGDLATARRTHTATLLPNGKVLVAGGRDSSFSALNSAELYDPATGMWSATGDLVNARYLHTATLLPNGKVLVAGGFGSSFSAVNSAELYDPATGMWSATGALATARYWYTATLLPNGKVLVAGGQGSSVLKSAELYDPATGMWGATGDLATARYLHTATLLPNGKVLVAGGYTGSSALNSAELYDSAVGSWSATGNLATARTKHTATLLPNGKVLVAGGQGAGNTNLKSAELYDPATGMWSATGDLVNARYNHTATLLPNGKVLVAGGRDNGPLNSAELYDPATGSWTATGTLAKARERHTATLLPNGKVLAAAGDFAGMNLNSAELYDPATGTWSATGALVTARDNHTATLLPNGKVLVAGNREDFGSALNSAELYDPATGMWGATGALVNARYDHTATLLPNGKVLVAGGRSSNSTPLNSAELYDPAMGTWGATGDLTTVRYDHTATLLPNGKVLVAAGEGNSFALQNSTELYDPAMGSWSTTGNLATARTEHRATLLPNGKVLVAAGSGSSNLLNSAELYDVGLGYLPEWQPVLTSATSPLLPGRTLKATGTQFKGISEASGGSTNNSSTNYPLVQVLSLVNEQSMFLPLHDDSNWSDTSFGSADVTQMTVSSAGFPPGYALVTVFTNGIPSTAKLILVEANTNTPPTITAMGVTRAAGAAGSNSQIAEVEDDEDAESALAVRVNDAAMATVNGVTVSNLAVDDGGVVTANVVAAPGATTAMFTLKVTDSGGLMATATLTVTVPHPLPLTASLTDPIVCNGVGGLVQITAQLTNPNPGLLAAAFTAVLPPQLSALPGTCTATTGTCTVTNAGQVDWMGNLAQNQSVTISYQALVLNGTPANQQLCVTSTANVGGVPAMVTACGTANCPANNLNNPPAAIGVSSQKAGSVLVYPYYTAKAATKSDTRMTLSNIGEKDAIAHLFFIDGASCQQADVFVCLTANASVSFKASEYDPETTGWLLVVAVDKEGRPVPNNVLIGNAFVTDGNYVDNYGAESFAAQSANVALLQNNTARLLFNDAGYEAVPDQFAVELQSPLDAPGQRLVTVGLLGDLTTSSLSGAAQVGTGLIANGNEKPSGSFAALLSGNCQAFATISTTNPRVPGGMATMIPSGQVGTIRFNVGASVGLLLTPRGAPNRWNGIRALHKTHTTFSTLTIPVLVPVC